MGGYGDWFYPEMSPFRFVNQKPGPLYGSQGPVWREADYPFKKKPVYAPDASYHGRNRGFHGGDSNRQWNETLASNTGSKQKPKVTSIPVQDGNAESLESGILQVKKPALPEDLEGRVAGKGKGNSEGHTVLRSSKNLKKIIPVTVSHNAGASKGAPRAVMSDNAAATLIQSHFRGHMVRRTAPLNSLRVISGVMSQLRNIRAEILVDEYMDILRADPKERVKLSETVMNLLLRLDALQGVHATVREIRKAAVREAVALQETVDSLFKQSLSDTPHNSKAFPAGESNCPVNGSNSSSLPDDQDKQMHLEAESLTCSMPGTFSENIVGRKASDVPRERPQSVDEEDETEDSDCWTTSETLKTDGRVSDDHLETASRTTAEFPRLNVVDDAMQREAVKTDVTMEGDICSDQNMIQCESSLENKCASANVDEFQSLEKWRSTTIFDCERDRRTDAEDGDQQLDGSDSESVLQDQERSPDAITDASCTATLANDNSAEFNSDALHALQNENKELKRMLNQYQSTNELQTSLIYDLRERLVLLERRLEERTKTAGKSSLKCKKKSSRGGRLSEKRSNLNRNKSRQTHDYWLEDENCDEQQAPMIDKVFLHEASQD